MDKWKRTFSGLLALLLLMTSLGLASAGQAAASAAADGRLDPTFNTGSGFANTSPSPTAPQALAVQSNGQILVGGYFDEYDGVARYGLARLNSDGSLDKSFAGGLGLNGPAEAFVFQSDGKIVVAGAFTSYQGTGRGNLVRLNSNGTLDPTFNAGGGFDDDVTTMVELPGGDLLLAGSFTEFDGQPAAGLARLSAQGVQRSSFTPLAGVSLGEIAVLLALPSGRIMIGGTFTNYGVTARSGIARLMPDGSLDESFDPGTGAMGSPTFLVQTIVRQGLGFLIGGGFSSYDGSAQPNIAQISYDGSFDPTLKTSGAGFDAQVNSVAIQPNKKILVGGNFDNYGSGPASSIARLNPDGSLDSTFVTGSGVDGSLSVILLQSTGKLLIGGEIGGYDSAPESGIARLIAYTPIVAQRPKRCGRLFPRAVPRSGSVVLLRKTCRTTAGVKLRAHIRVAVRGHAKRGDARFATIVMGPQGRLTLNTFGYRLGVEVSYTAKAVSGFGRYSVKHKYLT